ncbi:Cbb3-type cytochrome c oxidase subunit CcoP2 [compost metagenome]
MKPVWFATSFFGTLAVAAGLLFAIHSPIFSGPPEETGDGKQIYAQNCAACHGADGTSATTPDLSNDDFLSLTSPRLLEEMIAKGRPERGMPAWSGAMKPREIRAVAAYIKDWQRSPSIELPQGRIRGDLREGEELYATVCAACHGPSGRGGSAPALNNPGFLQVVSDHYIRTTLVNGRSGTPMRSFAGPLGLANLSNAELDSVVAYIRSWE